MPVGDGLAAAHADEAGRLIAEIAHAGRAVGERPGARRSAGEQILAVAVVAVGDVDELAAQLAQLGHEHVALALAERGIRALQREVA